MKKLKKLLKKQGFTLVELIIVIAIIAVLAIAAFMVLTKWLSHSRDSRKLADLDTIHKSMEVWLVDLDNTSYVLPLPDDNREVSMNGTIWYQGIVGSGVVETVDSLTRNPVDPQGYNYVYSLLKSNKRIYQIATVLESEQNAFINSVFAAGGTNRVEGTFEPALYKTDTDGGDCGMVYLPSIVVADGVTNIEPEENTQYFILDGETNNLLYGGTAMKNYKDIVGVTKDLDMVRSGNCVVDFNDDTILTDIINNLEGMIEIDGGGSVTKTLVTELINKGTGISIEATGSSAGSIPANQAEGISVSSDTDTNTSQFGGTITITPATDESDVTHYILYWADSSNAKVGSAITTIAKTGSEITYTINNDTSIPSGATKFLVLTKNSNGEMSTGVSTAFTDDASSGAVPVPTHSAGGITFTDTDTNGGEIGGTVTITPATDESDITHYVLYWMDGSNSKVGTAITTIAKTGSTITYTINANTSIPSGATKLTVYTSNGSGEMTTGISVSVSDDSSADAPTPEDYFGTSTEYTSLWSSNPCDGTMSTVEVEPGTDNLPVTLSANTMYILKEGTHIVTANRGFAGDCTGIVGEGNAILKSTSGVNYILNGYNNSNIIFTNLTIDGGGTSFPARIIGTTSNNTVYGIVVKNSDQDGLSVAGNNVLVKNVVAYDNDQRGVKSTASNANIENILSYNNIVGVGSSGDLTTVKDIEVYGCTSDGVVIGGNSSTAENILSYNNAVGTTTSQAGFKIYYGSNVIATNITCYNNRYGIEMNNPTGLAGNVVNNAHVYNNRRSGLVFRGSTSNTGNTNVAINNLNTHNNGTYGMEQMYKQTDLLVNNVASYNNTSYGIDLIYSGIYKYLNKLWVYNNGSGIASATTTYDKYYGNINVFDNDTNYNYSLIMGTSSDFVANTLNWNSGNLVEDAVNFSDSISSWSVTNDVGGWNYTVRGYQCVSGCTNPYLTETMDGNINYTFGSSLPNQTKPIRWNGTTREYYGTSGVDYNTSKKVGEW